MGLTDPITVRWRPTTDKPAKEQMA